MTLKLIVHEAEEGGYWAEVPSLPGCFTQGDTLAELTERAREAILAYLGQGDDVIADKDAQILEIAV